MPCMAGLGEICPELGQSCGGPECWREGANPDERWKGVMSSGRKHICGDRNNEIKVKMNLVDDVIRKHKDPCTFLILIGATEFCSVVDFEREKIDI